MKTFYLVIFALLLASCTQQDIEQLEEEKDYDFPRPVLGLSSGISESAVAPRWVLYPHAAQPVHAFYHHTEKNHVYTIDTCSFNYPKAGYEYLGANFMAYNACVEGTLAVHVFFHHKERNHVYTINRYDFDYAKAGYEHLGIAFYAYNVDPHTQPVYPIHFFFHHTNRNHVYTINRNDFDYAANGFEYLGISFYAMKY